MPLATLTLVSSWNWDRVGAVTEARNIFVGSFSRSSAVQAEAEDGKYIRSPIAEFPGPVFDGSLMQKCPLLQGVITSPGKLPKLL